MKLSLIFSFLFLFSLAAAPVYSQITGQIITRQEAEDLIGPVTESILFDTNLLKGIVLSSGDHIMIQIINGTVIILDNDRKVLYPAAYNINPAEVFHLFSSSIVEELVLKPGSENIYIEKRSSALTITKGEMTLDFSIPCPPYCS